MSACDPVLSSGTESIVDVLLPNRSDPALDELAAATFIDNGADVPVSPVDQLLMVMARQLLRDPALGAAAVVELPRSKHRAGLLLAITTHLLCRQPPDQFNGPVVLIGFDVDVAAQLRNLSVRNHRRMGLATGNPLSAHRLTRLGCLEPLIGSDAQRADRSLVYFNTRVGRPALTSNPPLVVLDATSVTHPAARKRAVDWALDHQAAAILAVGDVGDTGLIQTMAVAGVVPTVLSIRGAIIDDLVATFNRGEPSPSTLSTQPVLALPPTAVTLHPVADDDVNNAVSRAYRAIGSKPKGPMPAQLDIAMRLLRNGTRLAARTCDYRTACSYNPRPGELPVPRLLDRTTPALPGSWRHWQTASLGSLKAATRGLWTTLDQDNPKLTALWTVLDRLDRTTDGGIAIRCHTQAAAAATRMSLAGGDQTAAQVRLWERLRDRLQITTLKERMPAGAVAAQVITGAPPPWMFSLLVGIESPETHILVYDAEEAMLLRHGERWAEAASGWTRAAARILGAAAPAAEMSPIAGRQRTVPQRTTSTFELRGLSLADILDAAAAAIDPPEPDSPADAAPSHAGAGTKTCIPVHLDDGRTWWCIDDDGDGLSPVVRATAGGHEHCPVKDLRTGDCIVVPAGEGSESIHARLVAASRGNDDVRSLDLILSQFRSAARAVLSTSHTQREAVERVRSAGAHAADQLPAWARGTTIAPREPSDVEAVFAAADRRCPDLSLIYAVADALRSLNRTLGRFIAAIAADRGEDAVARLRDLVGPAADELLDEFVGATVTGVDAATSVAAHVAGKVR